MHKWVTDTLTGKVRVRTRAASEMLIRCRLDALASLVKEYGLSVDVALVRSEHNQADSLRMSQRWFDLVKKAAEPPYSTSAVEANTQHVTDDTSADESFEEEVVLQWRSARRKRSTPVCHLCDYEITGGGCSESERQTLH